MRGRNPSLSLIVLILLTQPSHGCDYQDGSCQSTPRRLCPSPLAPLHQIPFPIPLRLDPGADVATGSNFSRDLSLPLGVQESTGLIPWPSFLESAFDVSHPWLMGIRSSLIVQVRLPPLMIGVEGAAILGLPNLWEDKTMDLVPTNKVKALCSSGGSNPMAILAGMGWSRVLGVDLAWPPARAAAVITDTDEVGFGKGLGLLGLGLDSSPSFSQPWKWVFGPVSMF